MRPLLADLFRFRPAPQTGRAIAHRAATRVAVAGVLLAAIGGTVTLAEHIAPDGREGTTAWTPDVHAKGSPAAILAERGDDCWTTPADHPADLTGQEGTSVILSGGESTDPRIIHKAALEWYFGEDHNLPRVYGFCR